MSYNTNKKARLKDVKSLALQVKAISDRLDDIEADLEDLAEGLLTLTNSVITNIQRGENT